MSVKKILAGKGSKVFTIDKNEKVSKAIDIFVEKKVGSLVVMDKSAKYVGIITEKDIVKCYKEGKKPEETKIEELMTFAEQIIVCTENDSLQYAMSIMTENRIKHIPVMDKGKLIGLISIGDVIKAQLKISKQITKRLEDYISGAYPKE